MLPYLQRLYGCPDILIPHLLPCQQSVYTLTHYIAHEILGAVILDKDLLDRPQRYRRCVADSPQVCDHRLLDFPLFLCVENDLLDIDAMATKLGAP